MCVVLVPGGAASPVSWDHFFESLQQYYTSMRRQTPGGREMGGAPYRSPALRAITPQELDGLCALLRLAQTVALQVGRGRGGGSVCVCVLMEMCALLRLTQTVALQVETWGGVGGGVSVCVCATHLTLSHTNTALQWGVEWVTVPL